MNKDILVNYKRARKKMVEEQIINRGIKDESVIKAMQKVPRHLFIEEALRSRAYGDHPLPIGEQQTISQPYMVALMTEALNLKGNEKVLEIGTGSGYQTAILAEIAGKIFSIEKIGILASRAIKTLEQLKYHNAVIKTFDGTYGWKDQSPFDAIIVTAGSPEIPQPLIEQLKDGGRLVIPVGDKFSQCLLKVVREEDKFFTTDLGGCVFVKLIGKYGWKE